ncbi:hypothetical protein C8A00DRAFT_12469 [Chaetomidium leptoderma]|uniref:Rhodopsin domain-containing protein n=1 Tax=Chaetomidium leptoderma TaxID=669021 RepID=A0AAN6VSP8_9PEZI|nr:hypothetical protein C8A00DRAFT_12469 [Chaetomidium leptoderma]
MVYDTTWPNATFDNSTLPPPNSTLWLIPPDAGRSLQPDIAACAVITFVIASVFVVLRFYTRWSNHVLGASDWCILPALLCAAGVTASALEQMVHGAGKHQWEVDLLAILPFERAAWYGILFYNLSLTLSRISIVLLYKRIFTYSWIKRAIQIVLVFVIALGIWFVVSVCTACMPLEAFWDWSLYFKKPVYCQPANLWWANAALHIVSDIVVMALPMPVLSSLNLPSRQKYAIVAVFALGFFVCIISIVRLVTLIDVAGQHAWDATYTSASMIFWTTVEVNAAIACACLMTFKPLIQRVFPRLLSPSKGIREPALQWITPINNNNNDSAITTTTTATSSGRRHSNTSSSNNQGAANSSPHHQRDQRDHDTLEKSRYYHGFTGGGNNRRPNSDLLEYDLDHDLDLEAQRTTICSAVSTTAAGGGGEKGCNNGASARASSSSSVEDEDDHVPLDPVAGAGAAALRAPPRAHLRLSIQVTRSVAVVETRPPPAPKGGLTTMAMTTTTTVGRGGCEGGAELKEGFGRKEGGGLDTGGEKGV